MPTQLLTGTGPRSAAPSDPLTPTPSRKRLGAGLCPWCKRRDPRVRDREAHRDGQRSAQRWGKALGRFVLCFAIAPNLPLWLLAGREGIAVPGWISLDGLALGLAALWAPPGWLIVVFTGDFLLDIVACIHATFGTGYLEILLSVRYLLTGVAASAMASITLLVALSIAFVGGVWWFLRPRVEGRGRWVLAAVVLAFVLPWASASSQARSAQAAASQLRYTQERTGLAVASVVPAAPLQLVLAASFRSPGLAFAHAWRDEHLWAWLRHHPPLVLEPAESAMNVALPELSESKSKPNLVLALVESWGDAQDPAINQSLLAPFQSSALKKAYQLQTGLVPFAGTTGDGELRELCDRRKPVSSPVAMLSAAQIAGCLPWRLQARGYRTVAMDSNSTFWPGGTNWYRLLGFDRVLAYPQLHQMGLPTFIAGPFRSTQDAPTAAVILSILRPRTQRPSFVFFLTINAHLPIRLPLPAGWAADCALAPAARNSPAVCGWYGIERQTLQGIASAAAAPGLPPTVFLAVGDHAPPFLGADRLAFSQTRVPYVLLTPRAARPDVAVK